MGWNNICTDIVARKNTITKGNGLHLRKSPKIFVAVLCLLPDQGVFKNVIYFFAKKVGKFFAKNQQSQRKLFYLVNSDNSHNAALFRGILGVG